MGSFKAIACNIVAFFFSVHAGGLFITFLFSLMIIVIIFRPFHEL